MKRAVFCLVAAIAGAAFLVAAPARLYAQNAVAIDNDDIGGVVTGPQGPEAGVWVIAETRDLPTRYAKIVVTDDQGRYVVPDLPKAKYQLWVRGYGLIDSPKVDGEPGKHVNLTAVAAPDDAAAAQYYPAIYWYSMLKVPDKDQFGGKSDIPANITQVDWITTIEKPGLRRLPSTRSVRDADHPGGFGPFQFRRRSLGAAHPVRSGVADHGQSAGRQARRRAADIFRRLDRSRRQRRVTVRQAAAAAGRRAQYRHHDLGLGQREAVSSRPDLVRQAQSDGQRQRPALRLDGICDRPSAGARSEDGEGHLHHAAGRPETCPKPSARDMPRSRSRWRRRPIGAWSRSGIRNSTITTTCSTPKAGSG